ncbi:AMP-dependent synthetase/ligase [Salinactinospora qingdaonensis]|uniref:AMP-dependent synthetase/ligase n=1 Tax=Salinactinospora qingdaonensis TaxID=702744 RepID=A0ABP7G1T4_9ACTN
MGQSRAEPALPTPRLESLGEVAYHNAQHAPQAPLLLRPTSQSWQPVEAAAFQREVSAVAKGLIAAGVGAGDRVALVCGPRYEWTVLACAAWAVRAIVVPLHPGWSRARVSRLLRHSRPAAVVLEPGRHAETVAALQRELLDLARVWRLDDDHGTEPIARLGAYMDASAVRFRREETTRADPAAIVYPMGHTRQGAGVVLSHANLLTSAQRSIGVLASGGAGTPASPRVLMHLPPADVFGLTAVVACLMAQVPVGFPAPHVPLDSQARLFRPTVLLATPALLERIYAAQRYQSGGRDSASAFATGVELAIEASQQRRFGPWRRVTRAMSEWLYARFRDAVGGRVGLIVCGGGVVPPWLAHFYCGAGLPVVAGFGVAETGGACTLSDPSANRVGTVGRPLPGMEVRIGPHREVLVRGEPSFVGYYHGGGDLTALTPPPEWVATGAVGSLDEEGHLVLHQRQVARSAGAPAAQDTGGGEATPGAVTAAEVAQLERVLAEHPLVSQVVIISDGRPCVGALITVSPDQLDYWRLVNGVPLSTPPQEVAGDQRLVAEVEQAVERANAAVGPAAAIQVFQVLGEEFSVANGLVRPDGRLRRDTILRAFAEEIDGMYNVRR